MKVSCKKSCSQCGSSPLAKSSDPCSSCSSLELSTAHGPIIIKVWSTQVAVHNANTEPLLLNTPAGCQSTLK